MTKEIQIPRLVKSYHTSQTKEVQQQKELKSQQQMLFIKVRLFVVMYALVHACVFRFWRAIFSKMKGTLNIIHYCPLQAISFPTALLSETILFIDGKQSNQQRRGEDTNKINDESAQRIQIGKQRQEVNTATQTPNSFCINFNYTIIQKNNRYIFSTIHEQILKHYSEQEDPHPFAAVFWCSLAQSLWQKWGKGLQLNKNNRCWCLKNQHITFHG